MIRIIPVVRRGGCRSHLFNRHADAPGIDLKGRRHGVGVDARLDAQLGDLTRQVHIRRPRVVHLAEHARSGEEQRIERRALPEVALGGDGIRILVVVRVDHGPELRAPIQRRGGHRNTLHREGARRVTPGRPGKARKVFFLQRFCGYFFPVGPGAERLLAARVEDDVERVDHALLAVARFRPRIGARISHLPLHALRDGQADGKARPFDDLGSPEILRAGNDRQRRQRQHPGSSRTSDVSYKL